jgi:hypothetical protein
MLFSAALAAAGLVAQGVTTGISLAQGLKNRSKMLEAEAKASQALNKAKGFLQVNVYDKMAIAKEPFNLARQAALSQGALALQSATEGSQRGAAAAAGGVQMAFMNQEAQNRAEMSEEMYALGLKSAAQEQENMQYMASLNLQEAEGAAKAAADYDTAAMKSFAGAAQGLVGMATTAAGMAPDVIKTQAARRVGGLKESYNQAIESGNIQSGLLDSEGKPIGFENAILRNMGIDEAQAQALPIWMEVQDEVTKETKKVLSPDMFETWLQGRNPEDLKDLYKTGFNSLGRLELVNQPRQPKFTNPFSITNLPLAGFKYQ